MTKKESRIVLFSITLCWASSYIFIKDIQGLSTYAYLTLTSGVAGVILALVFFRLFRELNRRTLFHGAVLALLITGNMLFEKLGLDIIPASAASTFASMNIIIVPLILIFLKKYPSRNNIVGIIIITAGLIIANGVTLNGSGMLGALYMLASCVMMSLYTICATDFAKKSNPLLLTVLQLCITALIGFSLWVIKEPGTLTKISWSTETISYILVIAFFSKSYAYLMLMYADKYADPISVTVVASMEPVVTLLLALFIPDIHGNTETFSLHSLIGASVITLGAIIAGTDFLSRKETAVASPDAAVNDTPADAAPDAAKGSAAFLPLKRTGWHERILTFLKPFVLVTILFAVLGSSIDIADFAEGYTNIRPENFIPIPAGMLFGPAGALGCAVGNLIADFFADYKYTTFIGFIANFLNAYIPYRIWYALSGRDPDTHTWKRLLLFIWAATVGCLTCSWCLSFGLDLFFSYWIDSLMPVTFGNNLFFSLAVGLPCFIVLTTEKKGFVR